MHSRALPDESAPTRLLRDGITIWRSHAHQARIAAIAHVETVREQPAPTIGLQPDHAVGQPETRPKEIP